MLVIPIGQFFHVVLPIRAATALARTNAHRGDVAHSLAFGDKCFGLLEWDERVGVHIGPSGAGQTAKLCNQIAGALNVLAACEALMLASKSGIDPAKMLEVVSAGAAGSWAQVHVRPHPIQWEWRRIRHHDPGR